MLSQLKALSRRISENGMKDAAGHVQMRVHEQYRDWKLGIDTCGVIRPTELVDDTACFDYEPSNYDCLEAALGYLSIRDGEDVFLDYGCGKGRALACAVLYPFRKVIGIDISQSLCDAAAANMRRVKPAKLCDDVEIIAMDARSYDIPDDVSVIFMFNPFTDQILKDVQERIRLSLATAPRSLIIMYLYPHHRQEDPFDNCEWAKKLCVLPTGGWENISALVVYEGKASANVRL